MFNKRVRQYECFLEFRDGTRAFLTGVSSSKMEGGGSVTISPDKREGLPKRCWKKNIQREHLLASVYKSLEIWGNWRKCQNMGVYWRQFKKFGFLRKTRKFLVSLKTLPFLRAKKKQIVGETDCHRDYIFIVRTKAPHEIGKFPPGGSKVGQCRSTCVISPSVTAPP